MMPLNAGADQAGPDRERIAGTGTIGYCPVCRRPTSTVPIGPGEAMRLVAGHLLAEHDSYFATMLVLGLAPPAGSICPTCDGSGLFTVDQPTCPTCDGSGRVGSPFYPAGETW